MTVNLMQLDSSGQESITSLFQSPEERMMYAYLTQLEMAVPGVTIFTHRLSDDGHYLCTVPCPYTVLLRYELTEPRYCGCFDCIETREYLHDFTARIMLPNAEELLGPYIYPGEQKLEEETDDSLEPYTIRGRDNAF